MVAVAAEGVRWGPRPMSRALEEIAQALEELLRFQRVGDLGALELLGHMLEISSKTRKPLRSGLIFRGLRIFLLAICSRAEKKASARDGGGQIWNGANFVPGPTPRTRARWRNCDNVTVGTETGGPNPRARARWRPVDSLAAKVSAAR